MFDLMPFERSERNLMNMFEDFDRAFWGDRSRSLASFRTDVLDKGDRYVLQAELPGFNKEDIHIDINGDYLTVRAEHKEEQNSEEKNYVRRERRYGTYARSFDVSGVDVNRIGAKYQNGVLELDLPKIGEVKPEVKKIEIE